MRRTHYGNDEPIPVPPGFTYAVSEDEGSFFCQSTGQSVDSLGLHLPGPGDTFHGDRDPDQGARDR
jgi:hypothetical protein